jgi:hypothetical protein
VLCLARHQAQGRSYIKHRRTSSLLNTPSFESSCSGWCTANRPNASLISSSWLAVIPCSLASLEGRFATGAVRDDGARRLGGCSRVRFRIPLFWRGSPHTMVLACEERDQKGPLGKLPLAHATACSESMTQASVESAKRFSLPNGI